MYSMTITNNCEDMESLPDEQSNFLPATVNQFPRHMETEGLYCKFSPVPTDSWEKARLMLLIINQQELPTLETPHEELEEEFEMMQVQINGLKWEFLDVEAWKDYKYDLGFRDIKTLEFGVIKEGDN